MNSGIGDFARCLVGGVRRGTRKERRWSAEGRTGSEGNGSGGTGNG